MRAIEARAVHTRNSSEATEEDKYTPRSASLAHLVEEHAGHEPVVVAADFGMQQEVGQGAHVRQAGQRGLGGRGRGGQGGGEVVQQR